MFKIKSLLSLATVAALVLIGPMQSVQAQTSLTDDTQLLISEIQSDKRAVVLKSMGLTDEQVKAFTPIYDEYQRDRKALYERGVDLLNKYASNYDSMTDDAAKGILKDWFKLEDDKLALLRNYAKKFGKVLPQTRVARFVQIENKLNALMEGQAARIVPLTR